MGNVKWTTPTEETFLEANVSQYEAAQAAKTVGQWLLSFDLRWLLKFPEYSDGRNETPLAVLKKRIRSWFNNHTGIRAKKPKPIVAKIRTNGKAPRDPFATALLGGGADRPKQRLQPKQAYGVMMRDTSLKSDIEEEWRTKLVAEPELEHIRGAFLKYFSMRVGQRYDAESDEVKALVEQFREEEHQKNLASNSPPPLLLDHEKDLPDEEKGDLVRIRTMQRAIENMDYACACFANTVSRLSRASIIISVVGPEPKRHGLLSVSQISVGSRRSDGKDIFQSHGEMVERLTREQKVFAKACVDPQDIQAFRNIYPVTPSGIPVDTNAISTAHVDELDDRRASLPGPSQSAQDDEEEDDRAMNLAEDDVLDNLSLQYGFGKNIRAKGKFKEHVPSPSEDSDEESQFGGEQDGRDDDGKENDDDEDIEAVGRYSRPVVPDPTCPSSPSLKIVDRKGGEDDYGRVKLAGGAWVSNYEYSRLVKIAENKQLIASIDIPGAVQAVVGPHPPSPTQGERARVRNATPPAPSRVLPPRASKSQNISYRIPGLNEFELNHLEGSNGNNPFSTRPMFSPSDNESQPNVFGRALLEPQRADSSVTVSTIPPAEMTQQSPIASAVSLLSQPGGQRVDDTVAQGTEMSVLAPAEVGRISSDTVQILARNPSDVDRNVESSEDGQDKASQSTSDDLEQTLMPMPETSVVGHSVYLDTANDGGASPPPANDEAIESPRERAKVAKRAALYGAPPADRLTAVGNDEDVSSHIPSLTNIELPRETSGPGSSPVDPPAAVEKIDRTLSDVTSSTNNQNYSCKIVVAGIDASTTPAWIKQHFVYLRNVLQGRDESKLLLDWLTLESEDEQNAKCPKLPATLRPHAVSAWLRSKSTPGDQPPEFDLKELMDQWRKWWISLMPDWRLAGKKVDDGDVWPMTRRTPTGETWRKVRKVGPQGIFLALLGLAFWRSAPGADGSSCREYSSALEDVSWVMNEIVKDMVPFVERSRAARPTSPTLALPAPNPEDAELQSRRTSTRVSRPTKRKLGQSDIEELATRTGRTKRHAANA